MLPVALGGSQGTGWGPPGPSELECSRRRESRSGAPDRLCLQPGSRAGREPPAREVGETRPARPHQDGGSSWGAGGHGRCERQAVRRSQVENDNRGRDWLGREGVLLGGAWGSGEGRPAHWEGPEAGDRFCPEGPHSSQFLHEHLGPGSWETRFSGRHNPCFQVFPGRAVKVITLKNGFLHVNIQMGNTVAFRSKNR